MESSNFREIVAFVKIVTDSWHLALVESSTLSHGVFLLKIDVHFFNIIFIKSSLLLFDKQ